MALIELLVGLVVAAIVGTVVTVSLMATGRAMQKHTLQLGADDTTQLALAAIAADLAGSDTWQVCDVARRCRARYGQRGAYPVPMLMAGEVDWLAHRGLRRCVDQEDCHLFVEGVVRMEVFADMRLPDGRVRRARWYEWHGTGAHAIEVVLTMGDGRRFSRVVKRRDRSAHEAR